ncbi:alpha/beta-hydrolase [Clavulina sp. PMI_390]|nr:alpha/beta-hydrolase [Clavulina sp. PMI_390]
MLPRLSLRWRVGFAVALFVTIYYFFLSEDGGASGLIRTTYDPFLKWDKQKAANAASPDHKGMPSEVHSSIGNDELPSGEPFVELEAPTFPAPPPHSPEEPDHQRAPEPDPRNSFWPSVFKFSWPSWSSTSGSPPPPSSPHPNEDYLSPPPDTDEEDTGETGVFGNWQLPSFDPSSWNWPSISWPFPWPWRRPVFTLDFCAPSPLRPFVVLPDGTARVRGIDCLHSGVRAWLGIRYAMPPTGPRRLARPVRLPVLGKDAELDIEAEEATKFGKICIQPPSASQPKWAMSEDCLTLNVFVPPASTGTKYPSIKSGQKLPVMVWFYGGGLESGHSVSFNTTQFVLNSVKKGKPVIVVSFNYRLGSLGFLASSDMEELAHAGDSNDPHATVTTVNAGLYDMRAALEWVQRNIEAFGGDKNKVTVFGQSAGAISIGSILLADGGKAVKNLNLFRAAIMQSGAPMVDGNRFPNSTDAVYASLLRTLNCPTPPSTPYVPPSDVFAFWHPKLDKPSKFSPKPTSLAVDDEASTPSERIECLRRASSEQFVKATMEVLSHPDEVHWRRPFDRPQDGWFHQGTAAENLRDGKFAVVPLLTGTTVDEGTMFTPTNIRSNKLAMDYFESFVAESDYDAFTPAIKKALVLYPDDPTKGSPFEPELTGTPARNRFYGIDNQYKRMAALIGDTLFESGKRDFVKKMTTKDPRNPVFVYQFAATPPGTQAAQGIPHSSDIPYVHGKVFETSNPDPKHAAVSELVMDAWINFAWHLNPNGDGSKPKTLKIASTWPQYGTEKSVLRIEPGATRVIKDEWRQEGIDYLASPEWTRLQML